MTCTKLAKEMIGCPNVAFDVDAYNDGIQRMHEGTIAARGHVLKREARPEGPKYISAGCSEAEPCVTW